MGLEALLADGANLVNRDLGFLSRALYLEAAAPARVQAGSERTDDHGFQEAVHLITAYHDDRPGLAHLAADGWVEVRDVDGVAPGVSGHQSRPSATATSRSLQSSDSAAMAR